MTLKTTPFDAAEYLDTPEAQAEFITAALETGDAAFIRDSVNMVARAHGMRLLRFLNQPPSSGSG